MSRRPKRRRSHVEIAADRLTKLALTPGVSPRRMVQASENTMTAWAILPNRPTLVANLRNVLGIALIEAQGQAIKVDEAGRGLAHNVVKAFEAAIEVLDGKATP